jgi:hypothetical protein
VQDRLRSTFSACGFLVFSGSEDRQVYCWQAYTGELLYCYKTLNYTQPVMDLQFHPFDNIVAMCSIGPWHQVAVFQQRFYDAVIDARPIATSTLNRSTNLPLPVLSSGLALSDNEQRQPGSVSSGQHRRLRDSSLPRDSDQGISTARSDMSIDAAPELATSRHDRRNRRLAVVNKFLDGMEDVIVSNDQFAIDRCAS